ncbi:MAG: hypothetical protein IKW01_05120 [Firmicutes bacterium]|nr:hypothetical protein [Bacillota bacterium]
MSNFWDFSVWGTVNIAGALIVSMLVANMIKRSIPVLRDSLIPTSVLGGLLLLVISIIYETAFKVPFFDTAVFGGKGLATLEVITYHSLALGFIASAFRPAKGKMSKERTTEIFNTGVTTVSTYLIQAIVGLGITIIASFVLTDFFQAAGVLLPFGYGQGTGQALNYGTIYETEFGFDGGKSFGLTVAAVGFLVASIGGVIHLNIVQKRFDIKGRHSDAGDVLTMSDIQGDNEIPMAGSLDKVSIQMAFIMGAYLLAYVAMYGLSALLPGFRAILYGFNFLFGVLMATIISVVVGQLHKKDIVHRQYINTFLMTRISGFFFDLMIVAGIAAIRIQRLEEFVGVLVILCTVGAVVTYFYIRFICRTLFPDYAEEQFLGMFGMLTGTASTGIILLREVDRNLQSPVSDNLVYQNLPAIVFGFPIMLLATLAPVKPYLTFAILIVFFIAMNIILFRSKIFRKRK